MVSYNRVSLARKKELDQQDGVSAVLSRLFEITMTHKTKLISGLLLITTTIESYSEPIGWSG